MRGILSEIGYADALLARELPDGRLELVDGHLRQSLDPEQEVPVLVLDLDQDEAAKLMTVLDPLAGMAEANEKALESLLSEISTESEAVQAMLDGLAKENGIAVEQTAPVDAEPQIDRAAELQKEWGTATGQVWEIVGKAGSHRVMCGDSTKAEDVGRLMGGEKASLVFTDPPYGVGQAAKNRFLNEHPGKNGNTGSGRVETDIIDDDLSPEDLKAKLLPAFVNIRTLVIADDCTVFVTAPQGGELSMMMMMMREAGLPVRHVLIWKKNCPTFSMGRLDYDYAHEPILLTWGKRHKRPMAGQHKTSVWEIDKPRSSKEHPTMKPVELVVNALLNNSDSGDVLFDAYCGSGTSVLAAESTGRVCYGMEISPAYVAVILQRAKDCGMEPRIATA